jgi:hypothetical protein
MFYGNLENPFNIYIYISDHIPKFGLKSFRTLDHNNRSCGHCTVKLLWDEIIARKN